MSSKLYDVLKWVALVCLPALSAFYAAISEIWNLPYGVQICGTIGAVSALMGALLQVSSIQYHKYND